MHSATRNRVSVVAISLAGCLLIQGTCGQGILAPGQALLNTPPSIQFVQPAARVQVTAGDMVTIIWVDGDPDDSATIRLFYDRDGVAGTGDEVTIANLPEDPDGVADQFGWNTAGISTGAYRLGATIDDGVNDPVTIYNPFEVVIQAVVVEPPATRSLKMLQPAADINLLPGQSLMIRWADEDPDHSAKVYLYYDVDTVPNNANEGLIAVLDEDVDASGGDDFGWTIPSTLPQGTYYILGRLSNGVDPDIYAYAPSDLDPAAVNIGVTGASDVVRNLANPYVEFDTTIFEGYLQGQRLGEVMNGGVDFDRDGFDDFILVAPLGRSVLLSQPVGEAYLIYSRGAERWQAFQTVSIADVATIGRVRGAIFTGPRFSNANGGQGITSGIQELQFIPDMDGDLVEEIAFGIPLVDGIFREQQDYDPVDTDTLHADPDDPLPDFLYQNPNITWPLAGWMPGSNANDSDDNPPGMLRSGMVVIVSSNQSLENIITLLDETGQQSFLAMPRNVRTTGLRLYPLPGNDFTRWGQSITTADIDGDFFTDLHIARPDINGGLGGWRTIVLNQMANWTHALSDLGIDPEPEVWSWPVAELLDLPDPLDDDRNPVFPGMPGGRPYFDFDNFGDPVDAPQGHLGNVVGLGFFDADSIEDVAASAPNAAPDGLVDAGAAYLAYGNPGFNGVNVADFRTLADLGYELRGTEAGAQFGYRMAAPGDINGDLRADWLITAPYADYPGRTDCGAVAIVYGRQIYGFDYFSNIGKSVPGAVIYGANTDDHLGLYLAAVGDVDGDAVPDFVVSAPDFDGPNMTDCGAVYLIYGGSHLVGEFDLRDIGTARLPGKVYRGPAAGARVGPVARAGDVDGDLRFDFLIAWPGATARGVADAGRVWLIYGSARTHR